MARFNDGVFTSPIQVGHEYDLLHPERGNHSNYAHHVDMCIDRDSYRPERLENIVKAYDFSADADSLTATRGTLTGNVDGVSDGTNSFDNCISFWASNDEGLHYIVVPQSYPKGTPFILTGRYYIPSTNTNANSWVPNGDNPDDPVLDTVGEWTTFSTTFRQFSSETGVFLDLRQDENSFIGANSPTDDLIYFTDIKVSVGATHPVRFFRNPRTNFYEECFVVNEQITGRTHDLVYFRRTYAPEMSDIVTYQTAEFFKQDWNGLKSATNSHYGVSFFGKYMRSYYGRKAISAIGGITETTITESPLSTDITSGTISMQRIGVDTYTANLASSASGIKTALGSSIQAVTKTGNSVEIFPFPDFTTSNLANPNKWIVTISGVTAGIEYDAKWENYGEEKGYGIQDGIYYVSQSQNVAKLRIEFTPISKQEYTTVTALRTLTVSSHGITVVGTQIPLFKGDDLVSATTVSQIVDANNIKVPLDDIPGNGEVVTHIGDPGLYYEFGMASVLCMSKLTTKFYIPGVSTGITTAENIPTVPADNTPQSQLDSFAADSSGGVLQQTGTEVIQEFQGLFSATIMESPIGLVFPT